MAVPAGGAPQYPTDALNDFVEVQGPHSLATTTMQRGTWLYAWKDLGFELVRAVGVVVPPWLST